MINIKSQWDTLSWVSVVVVCPSWRKGHRSIMLPLPCSTGDHFQLFTCNIFKTWCFPSIKSKLHTRQFVAKREANLKRWGRNKDAVVFISPPIRSWLAGSRKATCATPLPVQMAVSEAPRSGRNLPEQSAASRCRLIVSESWGRGGRVPALPEWKQISSLGLVLSRETKTGQKPRTRAAEQVYLCSTEIERNNDLKNSLETRRKGYFLWKRGGQVSRIPN